VAVIRYHRYVGELGDDLDLDELVDELSDFFLESGFGREREDWAATTWRRSTTRSSRPCSGGGSSPRTSSRS